MHQSTINEWKEIGWGTLASIALHLSVVFLLVFRLHVEPFPEEQTVEVELVAPLPTKPKEKPQQAPASAKAARPLVFESMPPQPEQKTTEPQQPAAEQASTPSTNPESAPTESSSDTEPGEAKPATPAPVVTGTNLQSVPVPEEKARPDETNREPARKPAEAKTKQKSDELNPAREPSSSKSLFDPRVLQTIGQLPREGRIRQLCKIEAIARIRQQPFSRYADILVPYGASGGLITNNTLDARGGAFRNGSNWYNVSFKCQVDANTTKVVSLSLGIGGAVPPSEWRKRELPMN